MRAFLVLLLEVLLFHWKVLFFPATWVIPWDLRYYHFPQTSFLAECLRNGWLPLWNPYVYCGMPWYAKADSGVFYPPTVLTALIGGEHLFYFIELNLIAHILLGGMATYWLLRKLGAGEAPALMAGTVFQLGGFFASQAQHMGAVNVSVWMPVASLAVLSLPRPRAVVALAGALAMSILAGFPASTLVVFFWTGCLVLAKRLQWKTLAQFAAACVWSLALSAILLVPLAHLIPYTHASLRGAFNDGGGSPIHALKTLVSPNAYQVHQLHPETWKRSENPTFLYQYCGFFALFAILAGIVRWRRDFGVFAGITLVSMLCMLGNSTAVGKAVLSRIPGSIRGGVYSEFALAAFTLGIAICAGLGAHAILKGRPAWIGAVLVALTAADLILVSAGRPILAQRIADELGVDYNQVGGDTETPEHLRWLVTERKPPSRIDIYQGTPLWNNGATLLQIPTAAGDDPFALKSYLEVRRQFGEGNWWTRSYPVKTPEHPLVDQLNIEYLLTSTPQPLEKAGFENVGVSGNQVIYRNLEVQPRFSIQGGSVEVQTYEPNLVRLRVKTDEPAFLTSSEAAFPGWKAEIDGAPVELKTTNGAFRGLDVPAGDHTVTMRFRPAPVVWGAAISLLALAAAAVVWIRSTTS